MADIDTTIYQFIVPKSDLDSNYEDFEYLVAWYGRNGEYINYMFTDWESQYQYKTDILNKNDADLLQNIIGSETRNITVWAEALTLNDLKILSSIFVATKIIRIRKDGSSERIGLSSNNLQYRETNGRYDLEINLILYERALPQ